MLISITSKTVVNAVVFFVALLFKGKVKTQ